MTITMRAWIAVVCSAIWGLVLCAELLGLDGLPGLLTRTRLLGTICIMVHIGFYERTGTVRQSRVGPLLWLPVATIGASVLFRIMHWPYGREMFAFGLLSLVVLYCIHFVLKPVRGLQDILRLCIVLVGVTYYGLTQFHILHHSLYQLSVVGLMTLTTLEYLLSGQARVQDGLANAAAGGGQTGAGNLKDSPSLSQDDDLNQRHPDLFQ